MHLYRLQSFNDRSSQPESRFISIANLIWSMRKTLTSTLSGYAETHARRLRKKAAIYTVTDLASAAIFPNFIRDDAFFSLIINEGCSLSAFLHPFVVRPGS
ncbi:hypothetical protein CGZ80_08650 [Rhodopirellula sp. MGV]|nr:hypothetical protein CGZ80_08650 [Rhodopirellula sp. MGV]PNY38397.1 hypothetical protein C2E31_00130 [Rhodopirellula baltica]